MVRKFTVGLCLALVFGLAGCSRDGSASPAALAAPKTAADHFDIRVGGRTARMQMAVSGPEMERGLMERRDLGRDEGMIFVYSSPRRMNFWMRDTPTALDIGYFTAEGELAEIYPMYPFDERPIASRRADLQFALEMNLDWYNANGIRPGARLDLKALAEALAARGFIPKNFGLSR